MDTLEFGYVLMRQRPRLEALAIWLTHDRQEAGRAVRQALAKTWRGRATIQSDVEVGSRLCANLRQALEQRRESLGCRFAAIGDRLAARRSNGEPTDLR
jgi:hypothetical protein